MGLPITLYMFLIFILQLQFSYYYYYPTQAFSYSPPPRNHSICCYEQSLALLQFKENFHIDSSALLCYFSQPKTKSWNRVIDCCKWEGVTCDRLTGYVIGLDLSCSQLQGTIHSNSTLFKLSHLRSLNLAFNDFSRSRISDQFGRFASLTLLNLSNSNFSGHIPPEIPHLSNLVSLDLSFLDHAKLDTKFFEMLLQNLTQLRQISLAWVNISSAIFPANLSSSLMLLDLSETGLHGNLPNEVFHLPNLEMLMLSGNMDLTIYLQKAANMSSNSPLRWIDISYCNFSGGLIANFFTTLRHLSHLNLQFNHLNGPIPSSIGNLTELVDLDLSSNLLTGPIPSSIGHLTQLVDIDFSSNSLTSPIPCSIGNLTQLVNLDLSFNSLTGPIPSSIGDLTQLVQLELLSNSLTGQIISTVYNLTQLVLFDLSFNSLSGPISHSITKLKALQYLELSRNSLIGIVELSMFSNLPDLSTLDLSDNNLSVRTTNIDTNGTFPNFSVLGLSSCKFQALLSSMRLDAYSALQ
ncbi:hypothetical protein LguiA_026417 [Lonicera macranthoides]